MHVLLNALLAFTGLTTCKPGQYTLYSVAHISFFNEQSHVTRAVQGM